MKPTPEAIADFKNSLDAFMQGHIQSGDVSLEIGCVMMDAATRVFKDSGAYSDEVFTHGVIEGYSFSIRPPENYMGCSVFYMDARFSDGFERKYGMPFSRPITANPLMAS